MGIRRINISNYHPFSNGIVEWWQRYLHSSLSHYVDSANTNWKRWYHSIWWPTLRHPLQLARSLLFAPRTRNDVT